MSDDHFPIGDCGPHFYDYDAEPISTKEWAELRHAIALQPEAVRWQVAYTELADRHVSTVWLGLDHNLYRIIDPDAPPLIFETAVFHTGDDGVEIAGRYPNAEAALAGHEHVVSCLLDRAVQ